MADVEFQGANGEEQYMESQEHQEYEDQSMVPGDRINASKNDDDSRAAGKMDNEKNEGKIFVGGLSWETTVKDLKEYFQKYGTVLDCTLKTDPTTGRSRGFGFVLFEEADSVDKVLTEKQHLLHGRNIDPKRAKARGGREPILKVFVGGLDPSVPESEIREYFGKFGSVTDLDLPYDKAKGQRRAFCFVSFESEETVDKVCEEPKQDISGKKVDVKKATPKNDQYSGYGYGGGFGGGYAGGRGGRGSYDGGRGRGRGRGRGESAGGYNQGWGNQGYGNGGYGNYDYNYGYGGYGSDYYGNYDYNSYYNQGWGNQGGYGTGYGSGYGYGDGTDQTSGATGGDQSGGYGKAKRGGGATGGYHPYSR